jgi:hypothetical protein
MPDASPPPDPLQDAFKTLPKMSFEQWLDTLRRADRAFYNILAMEVWSIAKTMDDLLPGFWNRFMNNRQTAMKQLVEQKRLQTPLTPTDLTEHGYAGELYETPGPQAVMPVHYLIQQAGSDDPQVSDEATT